jgi:hypothetical protein
MLKLNDVFQWLGTACFMVMYVLMSFNMYPWNIVAGFMGGSFYLIWSVRVANKPQTITNLVGIGVCVMGMIKAFA